MKIAAISDSHGRWKGWDRMLCYPDVNVVILAGDMFSSDRYDDQRKEWPVLKERISEVFPVAYEYVIVPGNHDFWLERNQDAHLGAGWVLLVNDTHYIGNLKVYGNAWTWCGSLWAFQKDTRFHDIPWGLDILVTHDAPRFYSLPCIKNSIGDYGDEEPGNEWLAERVKLVKPKIHLFGHIHKHCHWNSGVTDFWNISSYLPVELEIDEENIQE